MKFRIISACMIASLFLTFFASSRSESDLPQAELLSYDYSYNTNFGIGYQTNTELERSDLLQQLMTLTMIGKNTGKSSFQTGRCPLLIVRQAIGVIH